jgi:hypothetical protein
MSHSLDRFIDGSLLFAWDRGACNEPGTIQNGHGGTSTPDTRNAMMHQAY